MTAVVNRSHKKGNEKECDEDNIISIKKWYGKVGSNTEEE